VIRWCALVAAVAASLSAGAPAASPSAELSTAIGAYRFPDGTVTALVLQSGGLRLVDYRSGAMRQLTQRSRDLFTGGPGVSVTEPVSVSVDLVRSGRGAIVGLRRGGLTGRRIPLVSEPVSFASGAARIAGRLLRPKGAGPFPAVVIVPGSIRADRDSYDLWALFFASQGFAVLSYDKRGVGASTGQYVRAATDQNLRDLASDVLAGVAWLRGRAEIDSRRIGLSGGSQAGWVIVLAASESRGVRFATIQSGPAMSVGRQLAYEALTRDGAAAPPTDAQIHQAIDGVPDSGFDPRPALASLRIPVLWQLGSVDKRMYTPETVADLAAVAADGMHRFTVRVYPGGAHSLRLTTHGLISEELTSPGFVTAVFPDLAAWLRGHVQ